MSAGKQLVRSARGLYKLRNLRARLMSSAFVITGAVTGDVDNLATSLENDKSTECGKQTLPIAEQDRISADSVRTINRCFKDSRLKTTKKTENEPSPSAQTIECIDDNISAFSNSDDLVLKLLQRPNLISEHALIKLFVANSNDGSVDKVVILQNYSEKYHPELYAQNGNFSHFLAKAHCLRGNSEDGLSLLTEAYDANLKCRRTYRTFFRDLIHDSVTNRSVASLVIFKSYVVRWSERWNEHYPLVCFWHACWSSSWFSDQALADELVDSHESLRNIIQDRASALTVTSLARSQDDDAVIRLLQSLLKHKMMEAYILALEVLFDFRLKIGDTRGCTEIVRNSKDLGLTLSQRIQDKYILMVIDRDTRPLHKIAQAPNDNINFKF